MATSENTSRPTTEETTLSLTDGEIHVCQDGPRHAPTLLLIHGTAASARSWEPMVPLLTRSHRVIRIDLLGCGRSGKLDDASYAVEDQARRAGEALDWLGVDHAGVVGHSSGGVFATALAEQRPNLVSAIVLINTGPHMAAYIATEVPLRVTSWADLTDDQIRLAMSDGFHEGFEIPQDYVDQFRDIDFHVFGATSQAIHAFLDERPLPARLAPLGKPLLVLFGEEDRRWLPTSAADYRAVPGTTVTMLPGLRPLTQPRGPAADRRATSGLHRGPVIGGRRRPPHVTAPIGHGRRRLQPGASCERRGHTAGDQLGETTPTDPRSQRILAGRRGGQLPTRAHSPSFNTGLPMLNPRMAPGLDGRTVRRN
nr:alpha/beta hydrolase [Streptomyces brasiliensis]